MKIINGTGIGVKKASGNLKFFKDKKDNKIENNFTTYENEMKRLGNAIKEVKKSLEKLSKLAKKDIGSEEAKIFEIHMMLL